MGLGEQALEYAARGWAVFPLFGITSGRCQCRRRDCTRPGKHPRVPQGLHDASTDPKSVAAWWQRWPSANIGVATGARSGIVVVLPLDISASASRAVASRSFARTVSNAPTP